jgi:hypothetical protein
LQGAVHVVPSTVSDWPDGEEATVMDTAGVIVYAAEETVLSAMPLLKAMA